MELKEKLQGYFTKKDELRELHAEIARKVRDTISSALPEKESGCKLLPAYSILFTTNDWGKLALFISVTIYLSKELPKDELKKTSAKLHSLVRSHLSITFEELMERIEFSCLVIAM